MYIVIRLLRWVNFLWFRWWVVKCCVYNEVMISTPMSFVFFHVTLLSTEHMTGNVIIIKCFIKHKMRLVSFKFQSNQRPERIFSWYVTFILEYLLSNTWLLSHIRLRWFYIMIVLSQKFLSTFIYIFYFLYISFYSFIFVFSVNADDGCSRLLKYLLK